MTEPPTISADRGLASPAADERVMAVVLTHNAPTALGRCISAIYGQERPPDGLLVVDNASVPPAAVPTPPPGCSVEIETIRLPTNTGPAGGHGAGLRHFATSGYGLAWIMDDDCVPDERCLRLLSDAHAHTSGPTLLYPTWIDERTDNEINYPAWCGILLPAIIVHRVGVPREDFFWWAEDTEYLHWRIPEYGYDSDRVTDARVMHSRVRATTHRPPWKIYYEVRNTVYFRLWVQRHRGRRFYRLFRSLARILGAILLRRPERARGLVLYVRGAFDGLFGRLGKRVPVQVAELKQANRAPDPVLD